MVLNTDPEVAQIADFRLQPDQVLARDDATEHLEGLVQFGFDARLQRCQSLQVVFRFGAARFHGIDRRRTAPDDLIYGIGNRLAVPRPGKTLQLRVECARAAAQLRP